MRRRTFLAVGSAIALAGCFSNGESEDSPAALQQSQTDGGVALTVEDAIIANDLETSNGERTLPEDGNKFVFLEITSENTSDEIEDLARPEELDLVIEDNQYEPIHQPDITQEAFDTAVEGYNRPFEGERYEGSEETRPDVTTEGVIGYQVPNDTETARLSWARQHEQEEPLYWDLEFEPEELADMEVAELNVQSSAERHESVSVEIVVENTGGETGTFRRDLTIEQTDDERTIEIDVGAGETATHTEEFEHPMDSRDPVKEATFEIMGKSSTVEYQIPRRNVGESYTTPGGLSIEVTDFWETDSAEREGSFDTIEYESGSGEQLAFIELSVENQDAETRTPPSENNFVIIDEDGTEHDPTVEYPGFSASRDFLAPLNTDAYDSENLSADGSVSGLILIRYSSDLNPENSRLRWTRGISLSDSGEPDDLAAEWSL